MIRVVVVGGLDPTGRAGLAADLQAVQALGGVAAPVATALTVQGSRRFVCRPAGAKLLALELTAALEAGPVHAVKVGMVPDRRHLDALLRQLESLAVPIVVDPVVRTSRGESLSSLTAAAYLGLPERLERCVLTPNSGEWRWLGGTRAVRGAGFEAVLRKGGPTATDRLYTELGETTLRGAHLPRSRIHHRGTGCRLASALATSLGGGASLPQAARAARRFVRLFLGTPIMQADVPPGRFGEHL